MIGVLARAQMPSASLEPAKRAFRWVGLTGPLDVLDRVGVDVELAVLEEAAEAGPGIVGEAVSDGGGFDRGLGEVFGGGLQEAVPFLECGFQHLLPVAEALIGWLALDECFEGKQGSDPPQGGVPEAGGGQVVELV